jgi:hypothetical protein
MYPSRNTVGAGVGLGSELIIVVCASLSFLAHTPTVPTTVVTGFVLRQKESVYTVELTVDPADHSR